MQSLTRISGKTKGPGTASNPKMSSKTRNSKEIAEKVSTYEHFLNEVLKSDLKNVLEKRDKLLTKIGDYNQQKTILEKLTSSSQMSTDIRTKVDLGCNFYVDSIIPKLEQVSMDLGCGVWLEVSPNECITICDKQIEYLNKTVDLLTSQELKIKAHINLVIDGLRELQNLEVS